MKTRKALIVDDFLSIRTVMKSILIRDNIDVTTAENGKAALAFTENETFDIIISDLDMPIMDGLTFFKELRKDTKHLSTPLIILTTNAANQERHKKDIEQINLFAWIIKPFDFLDFRNIVNKALK
ncbi:MAG: hypothetical protein A2X12_10835 [Bacteroidetes bacterium GWE2_29_8]|nr:MAG: hypothetical protein A2X12_10835 [Bacteroidetes bacterium GWE2_29_8]OFY17408.1 MAG: hypothetical protein A2X02_00740 [Bacteroidetes bacterium GWF2_29_10]